MRIEHLFQEHFNIQIIDILTFRIYICVTYPPVLPIDFFAKINILFCQNKYTFSPFFDEMKLLRRYAMLAGCDRNRC